MIEKLFYMLVGFAAGFTIGGIITGCSGAPFEASHDSSLSISPVTDGGLSKDTLAGFDGARSPGLDATDAGEVEGEAIPPVDGPGGDGDSEAIFPRDVLADPWPADVVVEPMPAPNCFVDPLGRRACCFAVNQPPVDCEHANQPGFCQNCPL